MLRSPHRTPSLVGTLQPQRRRVKTRVWRMHSARRRTEALAYECPPAPAVGRHLPLYFVRKGIRPAFGVRRRFLEGRPRVLRSPHRMPSLVGAGRGLGKVKEEVTANGRRRGTFAQAPACPGGALQPQRRRMKTRVWQIHSARRRADALAYECPPAPAVGRRLPLYFVRKGLRPAFGVRRRFLEGRPRVLRSPHRTPSLVGAGRGLGKVKEEVTANGRRRGTFAQTPACSGGALQPQRRRAKTHFDTQTPGKKRPGRGRDLPGPDCVGGGTHAMSVASRQWLFASAVDSL